MKEENFIQTGRRKGDRMHGKAVAGRLGGWGDSWRFHICMQINQDEQLGSETNGTIQGSRMRKESIKTSGGKNRRGGVQ